MNNHIPVLQKKVVFQTETFLIKLIRINFIIFTNCEIAIDYQNILIIFFA